MELWCWVSCSGVTVSLEVEDAATQLAGCGGHEGKGQYGSDGSRTLHMTVAARLALNICVALGSTALTKAAQPVQVLLVVCIDQYRIELYRMSCHIPLQLHGLILGRSKLIEYQ